MHSDLNAVESSISSPFFGSFSLLIISLIFPGKIYKNLFFFFFFSELLCKGGRSPMAVLWVTAFMSSHLLYCSHRGGSLFAQLPGCIGHVTYGAVTAISDAITRPQTNREVGGGLVKGAPLTSAQEKVFRTHL